MQLWPIQTVFISKVLDAIARGVQRFVITSPTGTGKSISIAELATQLVEDQWHVIIFTNRNWLIEQMKGTLDKHGIDYGVRDASFKAKGNDDWLWPVQISSLPTELSRVLKRKKWTLFAKGKKCACIVDEAHMVNGPKDQEFFTLHVNEGHYLIGVTASPLGLEGTYTELGVAGTVADGIACGALVKAIHYGPDEPDFKRIKGHQDGKNFSDGQLKKLFPNSPKLFGRILDNFNRLNPKHEPTLLFADSIDSSFWIAKKFVENGIEAAHIDGENVWMHGQFVKTADARADLIAASRAGEIKVICNRFVAREGVDLPWIRCVVAATAFGSLSAYLQSLGRGLRADQYEDTVAIWGPKTHVTIIDHGGNWWRHGSVMEERDWFIDLDDTAAASRRARQQRRNPNNQPFTCPQCRRVWPGLGKTCLPALGGCGYVLPEREQRARPVMTLKGDLRLMKGDPYRARRTFGATGTEHGGPKRWERMYWRARSLKTVTKTVEGVEQEVEVGWNATFNQAVAIFASENNWGWPDETWPLMPTHEDDFFRLVADVPMSRLYQKPPSSSEDATNGRDDDESLFDGTDGDADGGQPESPPGEEEGGS